MSKIILFDLPSKPPCKTWSPNPWKTRLALNFKGLDYETQWIEYPDIEQTLKSFGIPPTTTHIGGASYTIPALRTASGQYIMDSKDIAADLEATYPAPAYPSLHLDAPVLARIEALIPKVMTVFWPPVLAPLTPGILNAPSAEYFDRTRTEMFGMSLGEVAQLKGGQAWEDVKGPLGEIAGLLKETEGVYFLGETPSYADIYVVAFFKYVKSCDESVFKGLIALDDAFGNLYTAYGKYLERDDH